jgi:hypothetical protein
VNLNYIEKSDEHFAIVPLLTTAAAMARARGSPTLKGVAGGEKLGNFLFSLPQISNIGRQMQPSRRRFMKPIRVCELIALVAVVGLVCPLAHGQSPILDKTTFGKSQNNARDLQNSLIVPKRTHIGKEKTEQVDPQKLSSRSTKDAKFQGSLLEMGLGSTDDPDSHQEKARSATDQDSNALKPANASSEKKDSKVSKQADAPGDKEKPSKSADTSGDSQNKDQKATSAKSDEKPAGKEKASATKTDGDH